MNIRSFVSLAALSGLFVFSGCTTLPESYLLQNNEVPQDNQMSSQSNQGVSLTINGGEEQPPVTQQVLSEADFEAYASAKQLNDPAMCDKISADEFKNQCRTDFADLKIQMEAEQTIDKSACAGMSTKERQNICETSVENIIEQEKAAAPFVVSEDDKIRTEAVNTMNLEMCAQISTAQNKQNCEIEVILRHVLENREYCKTLTDPTHKDICQGIMETQI